MIETDDPPVANGPRLLGPHAADPVPEQQRPMILTLGLDDEDQARFDALRNRHFPPERNVVPAHVTLFHSLPAVASQEVQDRLEEMSEAPFTVQVTGLRFLGRGVAFVLQSPQLTGLRTALATSWMQWLSLQDRQTFRPHVTIQNKADPDTARELFAMMQASFTPFTVRARSLLLWRYLGGPWRRLRTYAFTPRT